MPATRIERDSLGEVEVPAGAYWGAQTERARRNFPVSGRGMPPRFVRAVARIKGEAARVAGEMGMVPAAIAAAVARAAEEVAGGGLADQFPVDVFQTGSGTSTNMNVNEVLANRASELLGGALGDRAVHPNDHVNAGQSSNDVVPTALHVAAYGALVDDLEPALAGLQAALAAKAVEFDDVVKLGRTHLQDAVPVRLGQEFGGYAQQVANGRARLAAARPRLAELALGGTAVGTGLNAPPGFAERVIARLAAATGHPFVPAPDRFEALAARDAAVETSGALKTVAVSLAKIADDLRWLASGPRGGIGEIELPSLQPGSSIMPGKVNPVIPEMTRMVAARIVGHDATITFAALSGSNFELNVAMPVLADALLDAIAILAAAARLLAERCVAGIAARRERCAELVETSLALVTSLAPRIGYDAAAEIAKESWATGRTVRELARERAVARGLLSEEELARALDARAMTEGGILE